MGRKKRAKKTREKNRLVVEVVFMTGSVLSIGQQEGIGGRGRLCLRTF